MEKLNILVLFLVFAFALVNSYQDYSAIKDYEPFSDVFNQYQNELDRHYRENWKALKSIVKRANSNGHPSKPRAELGLDFTRTLLSQEENVNKTPIEITNGLEVPKQFCSFAVASKCKDNQKYQSFDGICNNLNNPLWGAVETPYKRYAGPDYDDQFSTPRKLSKSGNLLPNPREISQTVNANNTVNENIWSHLFVIFGQFVTHDVTLFSTSSDENGDPIDCPCDSKRPECLPIPAPEGESIMNPCVKFTRSSSSFPTLKCNLGYREELNLLTSYLDLSQVYGFSKNTSDELRLFKDGLLKTSDGIYPDRKYIVKSKDETCSRFFIPDSQTVDDKLRCFKGGEARTTENLALASIQTLFLREHNRIAAELSNVRPEWKDEKLFFEARRVLIAVYQHIIYDQYIRSITGDTSDQLRPQKDGFFTGYNPKVNPSIANEFAAAAMRWGHSGVKQDFGRLSRQNNLISNVTLTNILEATEEAYNSSQGGLESIMVGLAGEVSQRIDLKISDTMRNTLFEKFTKDGILGNPAIDLAATNIQRGRDHGIPSYTKFRELCGLNPVRNFNDLFDEIFKISNSSRAKSVVDALNKTYLHVDDIDLWIGGLAESDAARFNGSVVGPTFVCLINKQFYDLKVGDRFYYENAPSDKKFTSKTAFTLDQLNEIRKISMSSIICKNFDIDSIQPNAFFPHDINNNTANRFFNEILAPNNTRIPCSSYPDIDFSKWKKD